MTVMSARDAGAADAKTVDESKLPVRILDVSSNKWQPGSQPFVFPRGITKFRLEFSCYVGEDSEDMDVDMSAFLFSAKGGYLQAVGSGSPESTDTAIIHTHDSVHPDAGKITEEMSVDVNLLHKRGCLRRFVVMHAVRGISMKISYAGPGVTIRFLGFHVYTICLVATTCGAHTFANVRSIQLRILSSSHLLRNSRETEVARVVYTREGCVGRKEMDASHQRSNILVLGDIRRIFNSTAGGGVGYHRTSEENNEGDGDAWDLRAPNVLSGVIDTPQEAAPLLQRYLREWIPSIEVKGQELSVRRVYDIVSLLPLEELDLLRRDWTRSGPSGVTKEEYLGNMLRVLLRTHVNLRVERQRVELTSLLSDLFDQICGTKSDGGGTSGFGVGKDTLAWEQFTTFWVEAATINTHSEAVRCWADETLQWSLDSTLELAVRKPSKLISLPLMHLVAGLEERGCFVSLLNGATGRLHTMLCPSTLQMVATGGLNPHESFLAVLDVECVDSKAIIVISSTDYAISVWHYNHSSEQALWRFSFHSRSAQILVSWVAHADGFLVSAGVDHVITAWCVDKQLRLAVMHGHRARVTGVTYVPHHGQFATCSFDKTVRLWDADRFKSVAEMKRRNPIKFIAGHADLILCVTLNVEAHVLSVSTRRTWCRLVGHKHQIVGAAMVHFVDARQGGQTRAITGDARGDFVIWDVGHGQSTKNGCADIMQAFSVYAWRPKLGEITSFEKFHRHHWSVKDGDMVKMGGLGKRRPQETDESMCHVWPDLVVRGIGGTAVVRTRQLVKDARAVNVLAYNDKSMDLIASTGQYLRFWNVQTSDPLRMIPSPCPTGITSMVTDRPDPRMLYLGTADGGIAVVHIVTGQLLFEIKEAHHGAVTAVVVCPNTREVISVGMDRRVAVYREKTSGLGLVLAGGIEEAHNTPISACAVSHDAQLIATASGGEIRLWNKRDLRFQGGITGLDADVLSLVFLPGTACFLASDSGGDIILWVVEFGGVSQGALPPTSRGTIAMAAAGVGGNSVALVCEGIVEPDTQQDSFAGRSYDDGGHNVQRQSAPAWGSGGAVVGNEKGGDIVMSKARSTVLDEHGAKNSSDKKATQRLLPAYLLRAGDVGPIVIGNTPEADTAVSTISSERSSNCSGSGRENKAPPASLRPDSSRQITECKLRAGVLLSSRREQRPRNQAPTSGKHNRHQLQRGGRNSPPRQDNEPQQSQQARKAQTHETDDGQQNDWQQRQPDPVYEIHVHWLCDEAAEVSVAAVGTVSPPLTSDKEEEISAQSTVSKGSLSGARASDVSTSEANGVGDSSNADRREKVSRLVIIAGSAGGWVEVWPADGLVARAGVDKEVMAAKLLRRHAPDDRRSRARATRHRVSGIGCKPPSAASIPSGGSTSTSIKRAVEELPPIAPTLRWEAHRGSPVSSLCALDKTPLVATASTDSTLRLFTLADVQVGAHLFKSAETLGDIDMRDIESVRIDRAEMWSCPSLTATDVKPAADIEVYRAFSESICVDLKASESSSSILPLPPPSKIPPTGTVGAAVAQESNSTNMERSNGRRRESKDISRGQGFNTPIGGPGNAERGCSKPSESCPGAIRAKDQDRLPVTKCSGSNVQRSRTLGTFLTAVGQPESGSGTLASFAHTATGIACEDKGHQSTSISYTNGAGKKESEMFVCPVGHVSATASTVPTGVAAVWLTKNHLREKGEDRGGSGKDEGEISQGDNLGNSDRPTLEEGNMGDENCKYESVPPNQVQQKSELDAILRTATGAADSGDGLDVQGQGEGRGDMGRVAGIDAFDKRRATLISAGAAKNHQGKVLYGNMYKEIKSGAACNTLVSVHLARKDPRGDTKVDTAMSAFLRNRLPSLSRRQRGRPSPVHAAAIVESRVIVAPDGAESMRSVPREFSSSATDAGETEDVEVSLMEDGRSTSHPTSSTVSGKREDDIGVPTVGTGDEVSPAMAERGADCSRTDRGDGVLSCGSNNHESTDGTAITGGRGLHFRVSSDAGEQETRGTPSGTEGGTVRPRSPRPRLQSQHDQDGHRPQRLRRRRDSDGNPTPFKHHELQNNGILNEHMQSQLPRTRRRQADSIFETRSNSSNTPGARDDASAVRPTLALADGGESTTLLSRATSPRSTGAHSAAVAGRRLRPAVRTSASLETLTLQEMDHQDSKRCRGIGKCDELDRLLYLELDAGNVLIEKGRKLAKSASLPPDVLRDRWRRMQERFDVAVAASPADEAPEMISRSKLKLQIKSTVGAYIRTKPDSLSSGCPSSALHGGVETNETLLSAANFGTYRRTEVEALGGIFLLFAREGLRITYDQWRKALLSNKGVSILKGLQFGMLDSDDDGEVSLGDITRAIFRRANDRDLGRIRRFLELWLERERRKCHRSQVRKAMNEAVTISSSATVVASAGEDESSPRSVRATTASSHPGTDDSSSRRR